jgi:hypothetical protein
MNGDLRIMDAFLVASASLPPLRLTKACGAPRVTYWFESETEILKLAPKSPYVAQEVADIDIMAITRDVSRSC